jgi:hypothetical protein
MAEGSDVLALCSRRTSSEAMESSASLFAAYQALCLLANSRRGMTRLARRADCG